MVAWASPLFVRSRRGVLGLSLHSRGRNGSGSVTPTQRETSRTRCVWGNTVAPELPSPPQRARPFHSHAVQTQASPPFEGRHPFHHLGFFGWDICSSLSSSSFGGWTACSTDSLIPTTRSVTDTGVHLAHFTVTGFLIHSIYPLGWIRGSSSSRSIGLDQSSIGLFDIGRVFFWKERGIGRFSWALQDPARNHPPGDSYGTTWDACRAYLSFSTFVGTGLGPVCGWRIEATGRRWYLS